MRSYAIYAWGTFGARAYAMLTDPAMIIWLDGNFSKAGAPNENLAREFLELFTLGHGSGYTETDVREGARALTGWGVSADGRALLDERRHDSNSKTVLRSTGNLNAKTFCELVMAHPGSAPYVVSRLWRQMASDSPPPAQVLDRLLAAYGRDRNLGKLTAAILTDADFLDGRGTLVNAPVDWLIGVLRTLRAPVQKRADLAKITRFMTTLGQRPFYPPNVGGWPGGRSWLSTAAVGIRLDAASYAVERGDISVVVESAASERLDALGYLIGVGQWTDSTADALNSFISDPPGLVAVGVNTPEYLTV